jgi:hypothetical protein
MDEATVKTCRAAALERFELEAECSLSLAAGHEG